MKKSKRIWSVLFCLIIILSSAAEIHAFNFSPKKDINGEFPPDVNTSEADKPRRKSTWYHIEARELINTSVEYVIGKGKDNPECFVTIGQAASILSYIKWYLYSDHGYREKFQNNCLSEKNMVLLSMQNYECRDIDEYECITREQLAHMITHIYDTEINQKAIDPSVKPDNILNFEEYTDMEMLSECYKRDVRKAVEMGYMYGTDSSELEPKENAKLCDLSAVSERIIHAHIQSHKVLISYKQFQTKWSEFNLKYLRIPTHFWNILLKVLELLISNLKVVKIIYRKLVLKKKKLTYA